MLSNRAMKIGIMVLQEIDLMMIILLICFRKIRISLRRKVWWKGLTRIFKPSVAMPTPAANFIQSATHRFRHIPHDKRLVYHRSKSHGGRFNLIGFIARTGTEQNRHPGANLKDFFGQLETRHPGHVFIRDE